MSLQVPRTIVRGTYSGYVPESYQEHQGLRGRIDLLLLWTGFEMDRDGWMNGWRDGSGARCCFVCC